MYDAIDDELRIIINPKTMKINITTNSGLSNFVCFFILSLFPYISIIANSQKKVNRIIPVYFYFTV